MSVSPPRIVSLLPSATEIVYALGMGANLVGRSHECDFPPQVASLPVCSRPRLDPAAAGSRIDARVRELVEQGLSVFEVDAERLRELAPDVLITQTQCEVCAVSEADVEAALCEWVGKRPRIVSHEPHDLEGVWSDILATGAALDVERAAADQVATLRERVDRIAKRTGTENECPSVGCIEWIDPLMAAGNWIPELVALAGGRDVLGRAGKHSPWIEPRTLVEADPDVLTIMPCGFGLERACREGLALARLDGWCSMRAVRGGRVYALDGHQYFNRPGPRLVESLEILFDVLHPGVASYGHADTGYRRLHLDRG